MVRIKIDVPMLFDIEKQAAVRWYIEKHDVCVGCPYHGQVKNEETFCIMRQDPLKCVIAKVARRFEKMRAAGGESAS